MGMSVWWVTFSFLSPRQPPRSPLFPYTTLFRSRPTRPREFFADVEPPRDREVFADVEPRPSTPERVDPAQWPRREDRKSTRLNSSHMSISYAVFCLKKKKQARRALARIRAATQG